MLFPETKVLGISVYTEDPEAASILSEDSLKDIQKISSISCLLVNFVSPKWTQDKMDEMLDKIDFLGIEVHSFLNSYEMKGRGLRPYNRMRYDSVVLQELPFYAFFSDSTEFRKKKDGKRDDILGLLDAVHYLSVHRRCGIVSFRQKADSDSVVPIPLDASCTGNGMVVRSMKGISPYGAVIPRRSLSLEGAGEELLVASHVLWNGYYPAVRLGVKFQKGKKDMEGSDSRAIMENNNCRFIQETFNHHYAYNDKDKNLVDVSVYLDHGGQSITGEFQSRNTFSYSVKDVENEVNEIKAALKIGR